MRKVWEVTLREEGVKGDIKERCVGGDITREGCGR